MNVSEGPEKKPSEELISMIVIMGKSMGDLGKLIQKVKQKAWEEGFSDFEIVLLARKILANALTCRQMNYWLPLRSTKKIDDCSIHFPRPVKNAGKKVSEDCHLLATSALKTINITQKNIHVASNEADEKMEHSKQNETILQKIAEFTSVSICNANSDSRSNETIETRAAPQLEIEKTNPIQPTLQNRNLSPSAQNIENSDIFQITKDCDFMNEHFKPRIKPLEAIDYLQQFVGKFRKIDFGFRVIE